MRAPRLEALRYAAAAALVVAGCGGLLIALGGPAPDAAAPEVDGAVMVELPAADGSAQPASDAREGPEQPAQAAAQAAPDQPTPAETPPDGTPREQTSAESPAEPAETPTPVRQANPDDAPAQPAPARAVPQAAAAAQDETAPSGTDAPDPRANGEGDRPHPSAHAITAWQRSLMKRLEGARALVAATRRGSGTVTVAFSIDEHGSLVAKRVEKSSGVPAIDAAGLRLVQQAAPFPAPPAGSRGGDLSFAIPIRFR